MELPTLEVAKNIGLNPINTIIGGCIGSQVAAQESSRAFPPPPTNQTGEPNHAT